MYKSDFFKILILFGTWRIILFVIAFLSPYIIAEFGATFPYYQERLIASNLPHFLWSFGNFDGVHYLGIAKDGYAYQFTQAFFPFYPLIVRFISSFTLDNYLLSALLVSNVFFLAGLIFFFKLISENYGKKTAYWSIIFLLAFPTSFYFGAIYTEGIFFALLTTSFYFAQKNKIILSSIIGSFASATRFIGIVLIPSLWQFDKPALKRNLPLLLIPAGLLIYMLYLKLQFDNPFYFLTSQSIFGQSRSTTQIILLPQVFYRYINILFTTSGLPFFNALLELSATIFAYLILIFNFKSIKPGWLIFSLVSITIPTLTGTLASMPRYVLLAFPIFIVLAQIKSLYSKMAILIIFICLSIILVTLFTRGYWVA